MARIIRHTYYLEQFAFRAPGDVGHRQRVVAAVALMGAGLPRADAVVKPVLPPSCTDALALYGTSGTADTPATDLFLGGFDNGHLLADALGGERQGYNLVPLSKRHNRGGSWKALESRVSSHTGFGIMAVVCRYDDRRDPRIPVRIGGAFVEVTGGFAANLNANWNSWAPAIKHHALRGDMMSMGRTIAGALMPTERVPAHNIHGCVLQQEDFEVQAYPAPINGRLFLRNYEQACAQVPGGWRVEKDPRWTLELHDPSDARNEYYGFRDEYALPVPLRRPYAILDYMSLHGLLDNVVPDQPAREVNINETYHDTDFPPAMRSIVMFYNGWKTYESRSGQAIYVSDAATDRLHPDSGTAGEGLVTVPQIDHIVPRTPLVMATHLPGATVFSNAQLVSGSYNASKGNRMWETASVHVGRYHRKVLVAKRGLHASGASGGGASGMDVVI